MTSLVIPSSVADIGNYAFSYCTGLREIRVEASSVPVILHGTFELVDSSIPVYVPAGSLEAYQHNEYWRYFYNMQPM